MCVNNSAGHCRSGWLRGCPEESVSLAAYGPAAHSLVPSPSEPRMWTVADTPLHLFGHLVCFCPFIYFFVLVVSRDKPLSLYRIQCEEKCGFFFQMLFPFPTAYNAADLSYQGRIRLCENEPLAIVTKCCANGRYTETKLNYSQHFSDSRPCVHSALFLP